MKPRVFIGSSTKGIPIADVVQSVLSPHYADAVVWNNGVFQSINVPIETLAIELNKYDFAVFVLLPEDEIMIREKKTTSVRDNVLFELGLFMGKLGRERIFFIAPESATKSDLHLPSDLSGITPSGYDPNTASLSAAVNQALYEMKQALSKFHNTAGNVIYDSDKDLKPYHFVHRNSYIYKDSKIASPLGIGSLEFFDQNIFNLDRRNTEGRYEIELRRNGPKLPSIQKKIDPPLRIFKVKCQAKVEGGDHSLRFVLKDIDADKWASNQVKVVSSQDWQQLEVYLTASAIADLLFRVDDEGLSSAPSRIQIRSLVITEEQ